MTTPNPLGDMPIDVFLAEYWQKKPLLISKALTDFSSPLSADELAGLACEESVESRLILEKGGKHPWELRNGPFTEQELQQLPKSHWTLLVQDVEKHLPELSWITDLFNFIPDWRLDDLMFSYAPDQGSVGPHLDAYDVFLLQAHGQRHWQIDPDPKRPIQRWPDTELDIMSHFQSKQDWVLEAGDILYLPPGVAHYGIAKGDCITCSIGFRAPSHHGMVGNYVDAVLDSLDDDKLYQDPGLRRQQYSHEISNEHIAQLLKIVQQHLSLPVARVNQWAGTLLSQSKADFHAEIPNNVLSSTAFFQLWRQSTILYRQSALKFLYINTGSNIDFYIDSQHLSYPSFDNEQAEWLCSSLQFDWKAYDQHPNKTQLKDLFYDFYCRGFYYFN